MIHFKRCNGQSAVAPVYKAMQPFKIFLAIKRESDRLLRKSQPAIFHEVRPS